MIEKTSKWQIFTPLILQLFMSGENIFSNATNLNCGCQFLLASLLEAAVLVTSILPTNILTGGSSLGQPPNVCPFRLSITMSGDDRPNSRRFQPAQSKSVESRTTQLSRLTKNCIFFLSTVHVFSVIVIRN